MRRKTCERAHTHVVPFALSRPPSPLTSLLIHPCAVSSPLTPMLHKRASMRPLSPSRDVPPSHDFSFKYKLCKVIVNRIHELFWPIVLVRVSPTMDYRLYGVKWSSQQWTTVNYVETLCVATVCNSVLQ